MLIVLQSAIVFDFIYVVNSRHTLKYGGTTAVAAFSVIMYVDSFVGMMSFGLCGSMQPAISYCYGAGLSAASSILKNENLQRSMEAACFFMRDRLVE